LDHQRHIPLQTGEKVRVRHHRQACARPATLPRSCECI